MYFAVVKLCFESSADQAVDRKALHGLAEKLRARFKVCAAACEGEGDATISALAITALGSSEERLSHTLDGISEYCEASGFGRIESEQTLMDHIDALADFTEAEPDEA